MAGERSVPHFEPNPIDYKILAAGLEYYSANGYPYQEVPWVVSSDAMRVTLPPGAEATHTQYGDLVGSGEQSYIELMKRGKQIMRSSCITPCFRLEKTYDELHHGYFMKLELIDTDATQENLMRMIGVAAAFYDRYLSVRIIETGKDAFDIVDNANGVELGSYGYRNMESQRFIYGTGVALPRLSTVLTMNSGRPIEQN